MTQLCTHVGCKEIGVGRSAETATNWLCDNHIAEFERRTAAVKNNEDRAIPRLCGFIVRANGGAGAMTERIAPAIEAGAKAIKTLRSLTEGEG